MNYEGEKKYPHIFAPGAIGTVPVRNRTIMCPMGLSASPGGYVNTAIINHYVERAKGGIGLIVVEVTCVDAPQGLNSLNMLRLDDDHFIPGMRRLAAAIHAAGARCLLQISHTGRGAKRRVTGLQPVGPSPVAMPMFYQVGVENEEPRELTVREIGQIEDRYAAAARRAEIAGFDGVEIHSAGYYLAVQFLSRSANIRTDEYGGERENRIRFHKNIFRKIKAQVSEQFAVVIKATLLQDEDITFEDGAYYATRFAQIGFDAIEVMAGSTKVNPTPEDLPNTAGPENQLFDMVAGFRQLVRAQVPESQIQFFAGGRAHEPAAMEEALAAGKCDFVFLGKAVFSEPHLVRLIREDRYAQARPCIGCGLCMTIQLDTGEPGRCSLNPVQGRGDQNFVLTPTDKPKKVVVVGAGLAGVEAAVTAKKRGHEVVLFEQKAQPGGQVHYAVAPPHKDFTKRILPYLQQKLEANAVTVHYNTTATPEMILAEQPQVLICATGVTAGSLPIPGLDKPLVTSAKAILDGSRAAGERVVIIGGGVTGAETAELLAAQGKAVTIVEMLPEIAGRMLFGNRCVLMAHLAGYNVRQLVKSTVSEIKDDGVIVKGETGSEEIPCDTVILSVGDRPDRSLYEALKDRVELAFNIGDSNKPDSFSESVAAGYWTAAELIG